MLTWITRRAERRTNAHNLYGSIVALSRSASIYTLLRVPDTVEGRFEILVLHMFACLERLNGEAPALAQDIVDMFFADMDTTSRELGVGDMAVPKKMRGLAAIFEDRMAAYKSSIENTSKKALSNELQKNIFGNDEAFANGGNDLARYLLKLRQSLSKASLEELVAGEITAPDINGTKL
ncbi:MAG: ubiquinol-cytochrome C chaperone family protein [Gammaproteobacteria bacterium]